MSARDRLRLRGGEVYDPAHGIDGAVRDVCLEDGRVVASLPDDAPVLDVRGMVVMPGGVDIHAHVASSSVNHARRLTPEEREPEHAPTLLPGAGVARSGTRAPVPSTFTTGYQYAGLGYTSVFDAAVAPLFAREAHAQLEDTPIVDGGFFVLMGNDAFVLRELAAAEPERVREYMAWLLGATGGYAVKIVNPGGIARWKDGVRATALDDEVGAGGTTPRRILAALAGAADELRLPHPVHVHCNGLGLAGNAAITLESMRALDGRRAHFAHLQFHSYGGVPGESWASEARRIVAHLDAHPELSADVGQVMFGPAATVTADAPVEHLLHASTGRKWVNVDVELETGCGVVPYEYAPKAAVASLQWVVGLELFLLASDPWRVVLSTDHPNGGSFLSYPELIRLLGDRAYRDERLRAINPRHLAGSALADGIAREYTLGEIAIITRAGPARLLGLRRKGHLAPGADADVTVYAKDADLARMFATPRYVLKGGVLVVEEGQLRRAPRGHRLHVRPPYDPAIGAPLARYFAERATVAVENFPVEAPADAPQPLAVAAPEYVPGAFTAPREVR